MSDVKFDDLSQDQRILAWVTNPLNNEHGRVECRIYSLHPETQKIRVYWKPCVRTALAEITVDDIVTAY